MLIPRNVLEVHHLTSKDESRPNLQCVHAEREGGTPRLTATDGHRLVTVTWIEPEVPAGEAPDDYGDLHGTVLSSASIPPWVLELHAIQAGYEVITTRVAEPARGIRRVKAGALEVEQDPVATSVQRVIADLVWKLAGPWRRGDALMTAAVARA